MKKATVIFAIIVSVVFAGFKYNSDIDRIERAQHRDIDFAIRSLEASADRQRALENKVDELESKLRWMN